MMRKVMMAALGGTALLMGGIGGANAAFLLIDDFSEALQIGGANQDAVEVAGIPTLSVSSAVSDARNIDVGLTQAIGGVRKSILEWTIGPGVSQFLIDDGVASFATPPDGTANITLIYDGDSTGFAVNPSGLGLVDLTLAGDAFQFRIDVPFGDPGADDPPDGGSVTVTVWDAVTGDTSEINQIFTDQVFDAVLTLDFADFVGMADFQQIGAMQFAVTGGRAADISVARIAVTVPEPATLGVLGLGLAALGFGVARRNRRTV